MKKVFQDLGYCYCGYWQRLSEHHGSVGKELWYKYVSEDHELSNRTASLVYIWLADDELIYVGESSQSVKNRMDGHESGFRGGSKSGIEKQNTMRALNIERVDVWVAFEPLFINFIQQADNTLSRFILPTSNNMGVARKREEALIFAIMNPLLNKL